MDKALSDFKRRRQDEPMEPLKPYLKNTYQSGEKERHAERLHLKICAPRVEIVIPAEEPGSTECEEGVGGGKGDPENPKID